MTICYYVSGHGLGHASRAVQVMSHFDPSIRLLVKSVASAEFFRTESRRPLEVIPEQFDVGVEQPNNRTLDWPTTFRRAAKLYRERMKSLDEEVDFLRANEVCLVVCDVTPIPLLAAKRAGVPCALVANFTWVDIYKRMARGDAAALELLRGYREAYRCADLTLRCGLAFPMPYQQPQMDTGLIGRTGTDIRARLCRHLGVSTFNKLVLLYFGNLGDQDLQLDHLKRPNSTFVSFTPVSHAQLLNPSEWHFPDVVATADAVMAKPGYGTIGECMANGTPVVYYPRSDFAEYRIIRADLQRWGGAVQMSTRDFLSGRWQPALQQAFALHPRKVRADGAARAARQLLRLMDRRLA